MEAQQLGYFVTQRQNAFHDRAVVPLAGVRSLVGGAGAVGVVQRPPQLPIVSVIQYRQIGWQFQRQQPAVEITLPSGLPGQGLGRFRQPGQLRLVAEVLGPALGGIQHVFRELGAQLRQFLHDRLVAVALCGRQGNAGQSEVAQGVVDDLALRRIESGVFWTVGDLPVGPIQSFVLAQFGVVRAELG